MDVAVDANGLRTQITLSNRDRSERRGRQDRQPSGPLFPHPDGITRIMGAKRFGTGFEPLQLAVQRFDSPGFGRLGVFQP